jgi:hypothetical protein
MDKTERDAIAEFADKLSKMALELINLANSKPKKEPQRKKTNDKQVSHRR